MIQFKRVTIVSLVLMISSAVVYYFFQPSSAQLTHTAAINRFKPLSISGELGEADAQAEMEFMISRDPIKNEIPKQIHEREQLFAKNLQTRTSLRSSVQLYWTERGPNNIGGRTRAFGIDVANPNVLIAGAVSGGLWKSIDDGESWTQTLAPSQIHNITCLVQDRRAGKTNNWYAGTGESRGSTTNNTRWGSLYRGDGVFKSTDNGSSWIVLPSTSNGNPQTTDAFDFMWNVATNPGNLNQDEVFAATYRGIYRSTNGGTSWSGVLIGDSTNSDIKVTSTGVMYASAPNSTLGRKLWRSTNGVNWTNITPTNFPSSFGRIIIATAPSNPNIVYFFVEAANTSPSVNGHQLWKYTYLSGDGSGAGGIWVNRGGNLPTNGTSGQLNSQGGYNMLLDVKPDNENFVILGGTDLFRSTDGFATTVNTTDIGGYSYYFNNFDRNHHPDIHNGGFSPTNSNRYYSTHDGGISVAANINGSGFIFRTLNNGYNVTQFYGISIAPESGSNLILGGAQDNSTLMGDSAGASAWRDVIGGDGMWCEIAPVSDDRLYAQAQNGNMYRCDRALSDESFVYITPSGSSNQLFVNPILLDPNNSNYLYYAGGGSGNLTGVWINNNIQNATSTDGWSFIPNSGFNFGNVSTLSVSQANNSSVLYVGTNRGEVKRIDNVTTNPTTVTITPPNLNAGTISGGFVRSIAVDPKNSQIALLCFGNYQFQSLWLTTNGGSSWTDVEGNLAGDDGPSVRWATICYADTTRYVFIGTSIGLLSTNQLSGDETNWVKESESNIGNVLIAMLDYRQSDRTLAVGTHGRGVFTTTLPTRLSSSTNQGKLITGFRLEQNYPNPFNPSTEIKYQVTGLSDVKLEVFDLLGRNVATLVNDKKAAGSYQVSFNASKLASGTYFYRLQATSKNGTFTETKQMKLLK